MPIYWVTDYYLAQGKTTEFQNYMKSDRAGKLNAEIEKETGFKYIGTYMPILGFGKYDCEDWYVAPDWSSFDKIRTSEALVKLNDEIWNLLDQTKPMKSRVMRSIQDVQIYEPPKEK
jgi:hypothetical protein